MVFASFSVANELSFNLHFLLILRGVCKLILVSVCWANLPPWNSIYLLFLPYQVLLVETFSTSTVGQVLAKKVQNFCKGSLNVSLIIFAHQKVLWERQAKLLKSLNDLASREPQIENSFAPFCSKWPTVQSTCFF